MVGIGWWVPWITAWEIAWTAPWVIGYRLTRMAQGGWPPNARDQREYMRMSQEKVEAFSQVMTVAALAWPAMSAASVQQTLSPVRRRVRANHRRLARG